MVNDSKLQKVVFNLHCYVRSTFVLSNKITNNFPCFTDENQGAGQDLEDDVANYNGDDDNQPESEDEKQAELAGM